MCGNMVSSPQTNIHDVIFSSSRREYHVQHCSRNSLRSPRDFQEFTEAEAVSIADVEARGLSHSPFIGTAIKGNIDEKMSSTLVCNFTELCICRQLRRGTANDRDRGRITYRS